MCRFSKKICALWVSAPLWLTLLAFGCNRAEAPVSPYAEVQYLVLGEEKLTLSSTLPGRVSALVTAEVRPQVDGIIIERLFEEGADIKALPGFPWVADLLMSFPEGTNEGYGPIFSDSGADRALVC